MSTSPIHPVILCGGNGTRLWPVSRKSMPKQFARLNGEHSLLQQTLLRLEDAGCGAPVLVSNEEHRFTVGAQAEEIGITERNVVIEPEARNTAAAICAAAEVIARTDTQALMLVAPSDHAIGDVLKFSAAIAQGAEAAREGHIVTFGIVPDRAATGYGYIELDGRKGISDSAQDYLRFVEKPDAATAQTMVKEGNFLWNAGIFLATVETFRAAFGKHAPDLRAAVRASVRGARTDLDFLRLGADFAKAPSISFDVAVMEKEAGKVVPMQANWSDLGSWKSLWLQAPHDEDGVATRGACHALDCSDTLLFSQDNGIELVGIGLKNIAAVATRDAVIVTDLDASQSVSKIVPMLRAEGCRQAETFARCERPWGHYEALSLGHRFQVKSIVVKPGGQLSLQSHVHRSEHWVVVEGTATVTVGRKEQILSENESVYIPLGEIHRLANHGKVPLQLIEVQTGAYLGEDDIVRYEDIYERA
ncbi:mannose-1-phosphate guanylyltransferase/mannose-6-phosphate isomerase [Aliiroseovarius sp. Z3]|uniref:mannose-1-phosphate guanylyltransferase/mannose-6-phosphate isomerase n=1 Tax=Aliiroseovarius sp. Z3 TaxID=2811402 RepID=UPI0023B2F432|nr:mannose-1-phosphate guanylyltransferase/mannose-6-phosphate isomerase [Aliiroseovarius sp. Z3]MDE9450239.1 mannose-1-phosphate guanylyltransferase/mannose-6-phosphate isomerase [Aliiroseovarius sp. Z3]